MPVLRASLLLAAWLLAAAAQAAPVSLGALIGARVADTRGAPVGTIRDFAVDVAAGAVRYAVVETAEKSRASAGLRAVAFTALRPGLARGQLVLDAEVDAPHGGATTDGGSEPMRARAILGMPIQHPTGAEYGIIEDLAVDLDTGRVLHAEVSLEPAARDARRNLPLSALRFSPAQQHAILTLRQDPASTGGSAGARAPRP